MRAGRLGLTSGQACCVATVLAVASLLTACDRKATPKAVEKTVPVNRVATEKGAASEKIQQRLEAIRKSGYPVSLDELGRWQPAPAGFSNATRLWMDAYAAVVPPNWPKGFPKTGLSLTPPQQLYLQKVLSSNHVAFDRLRKAFAAGSPCYPMPVSYDPDDEWHRSVDRQIRQPCWTLARLLELKTTLSLAKGEPQAAIDSIEDLARLRLSFQNQVDSFSLGGMGEILYYLWDATQQIVNRTRLTTNQLMQIQKVLRTAELSPQLLTRCLVADRCADIHRFERGLIIPYIIYSNNLEEEVNEIEEARRATPREKESMAEAYAQERDGDYLYYLDAMNELVSASTLEYPDSLRAAWKVKVELERVQTSRKEQLLWSVRQVPGKVTGIIEPFAGVLAMMRVAQTAMAVERYRLDHGGQLVDDLALLPRAYLEAVPTDPFTGQPVRRMRTERGYAVYSLGPAAIENTEEPGVNLSEQTRAEGKSAIRFSVERP
jgi:hypothetical protein